MALDGNMVIYIMSVCVYIVSNGILILHFHFWKENDMKEDIYLDENKRKGSELGSQTLAMQ